MCLCACVCVWHCIKTQKTQRCEDKKQNKGKKVRLRGAVEVWSCLSDPFLLNETSEKRCCGNWSLTHLQATFIRKCWNADQHKSVAAFLLHFPLEPSIREKKVTGSSQQLCGALCFCREQTASVATGRGRPPLSHNDFLFFLKKIDLWRKKK